MDRWSCTSAGSTRATWSRSMRRSSLEVRLCPTLTRINNLLLFVLKLPPTALPCDAAGEAMVMLDRRGRVIEGNDRMEQLFKYTQVHQTNLCSSLGPSWLSCGRSCVQRVLGVIMFVQAELVGKELQVIFDPLRASRQWRELQGYDTSTFQAAASSCAWPDPARSVCLSRPCARQMVSQSVERSRQAWGA